MAAISSSTIRGGNSSSSGSASSSSSSYAKQPQQRYFQRRVWMITVGTLVAGILGLEFMVGSTLFRKPVCHCEEVCAANGDGSSSTRKLKRDAENGIPQVTQGNDEDNKDDEDDEEKKKREEEEEQKKREEEEEQKKREEEEQKKQQEEEEQKKREEEEEQKKREKEEQEKMVDTREWKYVPRKYGGPEELMDDLLTGKSCLYERPPDDPNADMRWRCFDCGEEKKSSREDCEPLESKGRCFGNSWGMELWDDPPRAYTLFNPLVSHDALSHVMKHYDFTVTYERADCSVALPCFDISRCDQEGPIKLYAYSRQDHDIPANFANHAQDVVPHLVQRVWEPSDACILLVTPESFETFQDLEQNPHWRGGQNHFFWYAETIFGAHGDRPFGENNLEMASLGHTSLTDAHFRMGYDMAVHLAQGWQRPQRFDDLDLDRPRRYLLSFKGRVCDWRMPFQHHRWMAAELWKKHDPDQDKREDSDEEIVDQDPDIFVDADCNDGYRLDVDPDTFGEILLNSTFVFAPGGGGVSSFRLAEALSADAIPVVLSNLMTPYSPEVNWEGCVVRVSEARIVDLPAILRRMPSEEVEKRRRRCRVLFKATIGAERYGEDTWGPVSHREGFVTAMKIWQQRILVAHAQADALASIEKNIVARASRHPFLEQSGEDGKQS